MTKRTMIALLLALLPALGSAQTGNLNCGSLSSPCQYYAAATPSTGSANAQVVSSQSNDFSLQVGNSVIFVPGFTNTSSTTVNVDASGNVPVHFQGLAIPSGVLTAGVAVQLIYNGTAFDIPIPPIAGGSGSFTSLAVSGAAVFNGSATFNGAVNLPGGIGGNGQFLFNNNGALAGTPALTLSGSTVTLPDGSTWAPAGLSALATYATSTITAPFNLSYTNSYSSTSANVLGFLLAPTMTSTGLSSGVIDSVEIAPVLAGSANNIATHRVVIISPTEAANYTGTVATEQYLLIGAGTVSGNPYTTLNMLQIAPVANGAGIVSGTVTNNQILLGGASAVAGVGGTIANTMLNIVMPTGTNAGTATNTGISIAGNGQTGGTVTNWAISSTSTAPSQFAGPMALNGTVSGTGVTSLFASPPPIGTATPNTVAATGLTATGNVKFGVIGANNGSQVIEMATQAGLYRYVAPFQLDFIRADGTAAVPTTVAVGENTGSLRWFGYDGTNNVLGAQIIGVVDNTISTGNMPIRLDFYVSNTTGGPQAVGKFGSNGTFSVSSNLANSVTLAGSANNPILGINGGAALGVSSSLVVGASAGTAANGSGGNAALSVLGSTGSPMEFYSSSGATDQKTWDFGPGSNSTIFRLRALNDAYSLATTAYQINTGTTFNIASQTWNTSTTAGTAVQGMQLTSTGLNISTLTASTDVCTDSSKNLTSACGANGGSGAVQTISYQPGTLTSITATKSVFGKFVKASTLRNLEISALLLSCTTNPTITLYECGTSATCASPTTMASGTVTTTGTVVDGTISSAAIAAGDYVAWGISAGVCVSLDVSGTAQIQAN